MRRPMIFVVAVLALVGAFVVPASAAVPRPQLVFQGAAGFGNSGHGAVAPTLKQLFAGADSTWSVHISMSRSPMTVRPPTTWSTTCSTPSPPHRSSCTSWSTTTMRRTTSSPRQAMRAEKCHAHLILRKGASTGQLSDIPHKCVGRMHSKDLIISGHDASGANLHEVWTGSRPFGGGATTSDNADCG